MTDAKAAEVLRKEYETEWNYAYLDDHPVKKALQYAIYVLVLRAKLHKEWQGESGHVLEKIRETKADRWIAGNL